MKPAFSLAIPFALLALAGCATPVPPVEVTRFVAPDPGPLGRGTIRVEPAPGATVTGMEFATYAAAVGRELQRVGYGEVPAGPASSEQVAELSVERVTLQPQRARGPVSVGVGGSTGSYGSGAGMGIGIDLSGPPPALVETRLHLMIRDRRSGKTLWEGRAAFAVKASAPVAQAPLGAAKMAEALFRDFPGRSGETIYVP